MSLQRYEVTSGLWETKCLHEEHSHLRSCDWRLWTIYTCPTTCCDALCHQLLDPCSSPVIRRHIPKPRTISHTWWTITCAILGTREKNRHLGSRDRRFRAIVVTATTSCNS